MKAALGVIQSLHRAIVSGAREAKSAGDKSAGNGAREAGSAGNGAHAGNGLRDAKRAGNGARGGTRAGNGLLGGVHNGRRSQQDHSQQANSQPTASARAAADAARLSAGAEACAAFYTHAAKLHGLHRQQEGTAALLGPTVIDSLSSSSSSSSRL